MFLIQNGYLNGLKENRPSLPQPTIWKNQFTKIKYKGWNTLEGDNQ